MELPLSPSIIMNEKDTAEIYFKSDDVHIDPLEEAAKIDITQAITVQPVAAVTVQEDLITRIEHSDASNSDSYHKTDEDAVINEMASSNEKETDLDLYPIAVDKTRNCCYRCWYNEMCNECIIGLIDHIPDRCVCPCLLSCYRCLQIVLCCDWSWLML